MKKIVIGLLASGFLFVAVSAMAQASYVSVNYFVTEFDHKKSDASTDLDGLSFNFGQNLNDNFAIEGRLGLGFGYDTYNDFTFPATSVDYRLNFLSGIYLRGELPLGKFRPYAMVGLSYVEVRIRGAIKGIPVYGYESNGDFSYGGGLDFQISDSVGLNVDYIMLIDSSKSQIDSFSGGLKFYF